MKIIRFQKTGTPDVLEIESVRLAAPGPGEVRLRHTAIGLNFIDTYFRSGLYPLPLPSGLGSEAAGVIEALGPGVKGFKIDDRVAYGSGPLGAYAEKRNIAIQHLVKLPKAISDETAAAMMLKGMTARYLLRATYKVKRGETILVQAAAGGVGLILCQWAAALGAKVIGVVSSDEKAALALSHGCTHVINRRSEDIAARVKDITKGVGVPVVYDGVGQVTLNASLDSLRPRGLLVSFGNASGPVTNFGLGTLAAKGSLYVTRPTLGTYIADPAEFAETVSDLLDVVKSRAVKITINQRYALKDVASAHRDLEAGKTTGSTILIP
jgi:NADPH:quinone reductase